MSYLLDTHSFLWFIIDDSALSATAKMLIEDSSNLIYLSTASLWEMAIKVSLGRLDIPSPFKEFIDTQLTTNNITLLEIKTGHAGVLAALPFHHRDPFDRLIIAQSLNEDLTIIGRDAVFDLYGVKRHW